MSAGMQAASPDAVERLHNAMNQHDLAAFLDCFDREYRSEQPAHPSRGFGGREQVEKNWSALFEGIPDFHAELLATATEGETVVVRMALDRHPPSRWNAAQHARSDALRDQERADHLRAALHGGRRRGRRDIDETVRRLAEGNRLEGE